MQTESFLAGIAAGLVLEGIFGDMMALRARLRKPGLLFGTRKHLTTGVASSSAQAAFYKGNSITNGTFGPSHSLLNHPDVVYYEEESSFNQETLKMKYSGKTEYTDGSSISFTS